MHRDEGATLHHLATHRVPLYDERLPFMLLWSQKAGCTMLAKWFFQQLGLLDVALAHNSWVHRYEGEVFKRRRGYGETVHRVLAERRVPVVKVVRDPAVRAASAFLVIGEARAASEPDHWVRRHYDGARAFVAETAPQPSPIGEGLSFLEHLRCVAAIEAVEPFACDPHLAPQYIPGEARYVDLVVPVEHFFAFADALARAAPTIRPADRARLLHNEHHHAVDRELTRRLAPVEAHRLTLGAFADGRFPDARAYVNRRTRRAVATAYGADLQAYGRFYRRRFDPRRAAEALLSAAGRPRQEGHLSLN